jgi:hypothetical protein
VITVVYDYATDRSNWHGRSRTATVRHRRPKIVPDARRDRAPGPFGLQNELDFHSMIAVAPGLWFLRNSPVLRITSVAGAF